MGCHEARAQSSPGPLRPSVLLSLCPMSRVFGTWQSGKARGHGGPWGPLTSLEVLQWLQMDDVPFVEAELVPILRAVVPHGHHVLGVLGTGGLAQPRHACTPTCPHARLHPTQHRGFKYPQPQNHPGVPPPSPRHGPICRVPSAAHPSPPNVGAQVDSGPQNTSSAALGHPPPS